MNITKKKSEPNKILITGVGGDIGQSVIKCLKDSSHTSYLIGCDIDPYSGGQKEVDLFYQAPLASQSEKYLNFITNIVQKEKCKYIIPTTEHEIDFYNANRHYFGERKINILINNSFIIDTFLSKYETICFLKKHGFLYPKTYLLSEYNDELKFPIIVKPEKGCGSKKIQIIYDEVDLNYIKLKYKNAIVQEIVGNIDEEYTVGIFSDGCKVYSIAFHRYLGYGSLTKFAELVINNEIESLAVRIAHACKLRGSINVQMRKTKRGFIPFEINPRLSSTVYFRHFFGFRDVEWWIGMYEGNQIEYTLKYDKGIGVRTINETFFDLK